MYWTETNQLSESDRNSSWLWSLRRTLTSSSWTSAPAHQLVRRWCSSRNRRIVATWTVHSMGRRLVHPPRCPPFALNTVAHSRVGIKLRRKETRSQAVARIADRTAKYCRGHVTLAAPTFRENYLCARSALPIQSCVPNLKSRAQVVFEILRSKRIGVTSLTFQGHATSSVTGPSLTIFRQRLKTHLFRRSYPDLIIWHSDL